MYIEEKRVYPGSVCISFTLFDVSSIKNALRVQTFVRAVHGTAIKPAKRVPSPPTLQIIRYTSINLQRDRRTIPIYVGSIYASEQIIFSLVSGRVWVRDI